MSLGTVAVTGATGFLATEVVSQLVSKGYKVHATVRNLQSEPTTQFAALFPTVKLFEADLLVPHSFDKAFEGVDYVVHAASPFQVKNITDPQKQLIDPALEGTKNVLESVAKYGSVKVAVVTGSCAAVVEQIPTDDGTKVWTEDDWNTTSTLTLGPYRLSKVLAERYTWEWSEKHPHVRVITILPTAILGPPLTSRADAVSIQIVKEMLEGTAKAAGGAGASSSGAVDLRDTARAHVNAIENPNAKGRYILSSERGIPRIQYAEVLRKHFPDWPLPDKTNGELKYGGGNVTNGKYSNEKARKELGITFTPLETSLVDMANKLIQLGIIVKPN